MIAEPPADPPVEHRVAGFFARREDAERTRDTLLGRGLAPGRLRIFNAEPGVPDADASSNEVLKDMAVDGAIGAAVGTGVGVLAEVALVAANVSLFVASPLLAPLVLLGWGATVGGTVGAMVGARGPKNSFADLVHDAIAQGQVVLVVQATGEDETAMARTVVSDAVAHDTDVSTV